MEDQLIDKKQIDLLYQILRIRMIEDEIAIRYPQAKMRCPVHLSIGQEAVATMVCDNLKKSDLAVSTHRAHAHYLAKGGSLKGLIAELYGKRTGCTQGRGGSMNLSDLQAGFVASKAIVANTVPIGVGLAFAQQLKRSDSITAVFFGDATVEEGVVFESVNFAVLRKLPVIFICENNLYSVNTPFHLRQPADRSIYKMFEAVGVKSMRLDGNDTQNSYSHVCDAVKDLRKNGGVWFLEFDTYRYKVHCGPEDDNHPERPEDERTYWLARDPLHVLESQLLDSNKVTKEEINAWRAEIQKEVNDAFTFAEESEFPDEAERFKYHYAKDNSAWLESKLTDVGLELVCNE